MKIQEKYINQKNALIDFLKYKNKYLSFFFLVSTILITFTKYQTTKRYDLRTYYK
jgi:hypothetical protein